MWTYDESTGYIFRDGVRKGSLNGHGVEHVYFPGKGMVASHRMAFFIKEGRWPDQIDHIDGNQQNNKWSNLREATKSQNMMNTKTYSTSLTGVKGVTFIKRTGRYLCRICKEGIHYRSPSFKTIDEAEEWIEFVRPILHGEFAFGGARCGL